ncbi:MAG: hypothetical protein WCE46_05655 [Methanoregula sp.]|uniref:hypothetical protein n=1 Tax=Methanoregula sp. TaxID=2052170 RepID=UPI003C7777A3
MDILSNISSTVFLPNSSTDYFALTQIIGMLILFSGFTIGFLFVHKSTSSGIKNINPLEFTEGWRHTTLNVIRLCWNFGWITFFAFLISLTLIKPLLEGYSQLPQLNIEYILVIFIISSGLLVRWIYIKISQQMGNVVLDFYAVPGILLFLGLFASGVFFSLVNVAFLWLLLFSLIFGFAGEAGLYLIRRTSDYRHEITGLHEALNFVPLRSKVITGREQLYQNLANLLDKGSGDNKASKSVVGTSIFFDCDKGGKYLEALGKFIGTDHNGDLVRYLGPKQKIAGENDESFEKRCQNIEKRVNLGVTVKHFPIKPNTFRFLVVNHRYVSIEFPNPQVKSIGGGIDRARSVVAICFENESIASLLCAIFENMWINALQLESESERLASEERDTNIDVI